LPEGSTPIAQIPDELKDYNEDVRYYTTKAMNGGTTFKCTLCEHSVSTLDFNITNGNRRTQAAAMINQHAASSHLRMSAPIKLGGRGAL
jgi:hypothetical protein